MLFRSVVFLAWGTASGFSQSNTIIDGFLEKEQADYATSAYFILSAAGVIPETASPAEAVEKARTEWGLAPPEGREAVRLGEFSHLLMKAFGIPGGLMYTLMPGPRYAAREIAYLEFVLDKTSPWRTISGEEALGIVGEALAWKEARP